MFTPSYSLWTPLFSSSPTTCYQKARKQTKRKLKVLPLNCNGLKGSNKQAEFHTLVELHQPDVILGRESKIDPSIPTSSIFWDKYKMFRKDRTASGGGVFIATRNDLTALREPRFDVGDCLNQIVTASLQFSRTKKLYIASFCNPSATDPGPLELLDEYLSKLYNHSKFPQLTLGGYFNCIGINWPNLQLHLQLPVHICDRVLLELVDKFGLTRHVRWPTCLDRTLDLAFSSLPNTISACHVTTGISDYEAVLFEVEA